MATSIKMPQLGESVTEGTIGRWLKAVGEPVARDEPLVEVITDKVNVEVPSPEAGFLVQIAVEEGQTVPVGTEIAMLDASPPGNTAGGTGPAAKAQSAPGPVAAGKSGPSKARDSARAVAAATPTTPDRPSSVAAADDGVEPGEGADAPRTSPLVRRLAREHGIDLAEIEGSGLGGRVTREDVMAFLERRGTTAPAPERVPDAAAAAPAAVTATPASQPSTPVAAGPRLPSAPTPPRPGADTWVPLTPMRRAIAEHMVRSVTTAPHVTMCVEIDVTGVARRREQLQPEFREREGFELTYLPFVARAVVEALREHPVLNSSFTVRDDGQQGITLKSQINLGVAIGLDDGLMVPVIKSADSLNVAGLARAARDLAVRARSGKLSPDDMRGGTFTLNNTGRFGSVSSSPIINQGQAAIITMEAVTRKPVVIQRDGEEVIAIRSIMGSCLTFDHRILDGLQAGRFLASVRTRLEAVGPETSIY